MTFWVHHKIDPNQGSDIDNFEPPRSKIIGGKGYPLVHIHYLGVELIFSSKEEIEHAIEILGTKNLPTTSALSAKHTLSVGPNSHWLSRLPAHLKPWNKREKLIPQLQKAKEVFCAAYDK